MLEHTTLAAERRRTLGLTQRELAALAAVSERSIQALEALGLALAALPKSQARRLCSADAMAVLGAP